MNDELLIKFQKSVFNGTMNILGGNGVECDTNSTVCYDDGCTTKMEDTVTNDGISSEEIGDNYVDDNPCLQ